MELMILAVTAIGVIGLLAWLFCRSIRFAHERSTKFVEGVFLKTLDRGLSAADYGMRSKEIEAKTEEAILAGQLSSKDIDRLAAVKNIGQNRDPVFDGLTIPGVEETSVMSRSRDNGLPIG